MFFSEKDENKNSGKEKNKNKKHAGHAGNSFFIDAMIYIKYTMAALLLLIIAQVAIFTIILLFYEFAQTPFLDKTALAFAENLTGGEMVSWFIFYYIWVAILVSGWHFWGQLLNVRLPQKHQKMLDVVICTLVLLWIIPVIPAIIAYFVAGSNGVFVFLSLPGIAVAIGGIMLSVFLGVCWHMYI